YGTLELESAATGKDWISGRELGTGERVFRGVLAPLDIVPGVNGLSKFSNTVRLAHMGDVAELGLKTGIKAGIQRESRHVANMVIDAGKDSAARIRSAKAWAKEVPGKVKQKVTDDIIDTARLMDSTHTFAKNILPSRQMGLLAEGVGSIRAPAENTHTIENGVRALFSKTDEVNIGSRPVNKDKDTGIGNINDIKDIAKMTVEDIPTAKSGKFNEFFNSLTSSELDELWKDKRIRKKIERQLRAPGGLHEWHLVSRAPQFKFWNISAEEIKELRTAISDVKFINPNGIHGGLGSTKAHNELLEIIDTSNDYNTFVRRLNNWANYRLKGGISSLPEGLRLK
ncbi:hypothetical protein P9232_11765, partial [Weizmannia sp. CD-2023]|nr:hypothetical protein [Weizmannia sp. CD-2023]